jgi:hypothetical protein
VPVARPDTVTCERQRPRRPYLLGAIQAKILLRVAILRRQRAAGVDMRDSSSQTGALLYAR